MDPAQSVSRLIIPPHETEKLVAGLDQVFLRNCPCRIKAGNCPTENWEVCLLFETASQEDLAQARKITTDEALEIIRMTTKRGEIHQVFYYSDRGQPYEICNCCSCCCSPLLKAKGEGDGFAGQLRTGYYALTDPDRCLGYGDCIESCFFGARKLEVGSLVFDDVLCFGCGRCLSACPESAIQLEFNPGRGIPIPSF